MTLVRREIRVLQAGRALAALSVVVHHSDLATQAFCKNYPDYQHSVLTFGYLGVDFFFVLSGFIIYHSSFCAIPNRNTLLKYAASRFSRVYVPYIPIGYGLAVTYIIFPDLSASGRDWGVWPTITLLPSSFPPALSVAWTLQHEFIFYMIFAIGYATRLLKYFIVAWVLAILALLPFLRTGIPWYTIFGSINIEFAFGVFAAWIVHADKKWPTSLAVIISTLSLVMFIETKGQREASLLIGTVFACFVPVLVRAELRSQIKISPVLNLLGAASYAIYLVHNPMISLVARLLRHASWMAALPILAIQSVIAGLIYHFCFERYAVDLVKKTLVRGQS